MVYQRVLHIGMERMIDAVDAAGPTKSIESQCIPFPTSMPREEGSFIVGSEINS